MTALSFFCASCKSGPTPKKDIDTSAFVATPEHTTDHLAETNPQCTASGLELYETRNRTEIAQAFNEHRMSKNGISIDFPDPAVAALKKNRRGVFSQFSAGHARM